MIIDDPEILNEFLESTFQEIKLRFKILLLNLMYIPYDYNEDTDSVNSVKFIFFYFLYSTYLNMNYIIILLYTPLDGI